MTSDRREPRHYLCVYLDVIDLYTNRLLGSMGDISRTGVMFISEKPLPLNHLLDIRILLPEADEFPKKFIEAQVETRWTKPNINPQWHCIGCCFIKINQEDLSIIDKIGEYFGFTPHFEVQRVRTEHHENE